MDKEGWPPVIDHRRVVKEESGAFREETIRFFYYGVQHGVGAYVEQIPEQ